MPQSITISLPKKIEINIRPWTFDHAESFELTVFKTVLGGMAGGLIAGVLQSSFRAFGFVSFVNLVFLGVALSTAFQSRSWKKALLAAGFGLLAAMIIHIYAQHWPVFAFALCGMALSPLFLRKKQIASFFVSAMAAALSVSAGIYVVQAMFHHQVLTTSMPTPLWTSIYGGVLGLFVGLSASAQRLKRSQSPMAIKLDTMIKTTKDEELSPLLLRTQELHQVIQIDFEQNKTKQFPDIPERVDDLVRCIHKLSAQFLGLKAELKSQNAEGLRNRIADLNKKKTEVKDAHAKNIFGDTISNLEEQQHALSRITANHERILARIHSKVALFERLRFALLQLRSANMDHDSEDGDEFKLCIEALSEEIEATCAAVNEIDARRFSLEAVNSLGACKMDTAEITQKESEAV
jgi:hypothetical protein